MSLMWDVLTGKESVRTLKKQLDKELIHSVYAPRKRSKFHDIITLHHKEIDEVAINTKTAIHKVANQLDEAIKGEFRSKVEEAIESNQQKYNHL